MRSRPNLLLRAIVVSLLIGASRALAEWYAKVHGHLYVSPENLGRFSGQALESAFMAFIPVALILWAWQAVVDALGKRKTAT